MRSFAHCTLLAAWFLSLTCTGSAQAVRQGTAAAPQRPAQALAPGPDSTDLLLLGALAKNPITAPYRFAVYPDQNGWVLAGRVGTKAIYDEAIQTALSVTPRFIDRLVIDTAVVQASIDAGQGVPVTMGSVWPWGFHARPGPPPYVYPPPLFQGWWMDPFHGMEPPLVTLPPGWAAADTLQAPPGMIPGTEPNAFQGALPQQFTIVPDANAAPAQIQPQPQPQPQPGAREQPRAGQPATTNGTNLNLPIEMVIDPRGVAIIRGNVPSLEARIAIGQKIATLPGVTQVINQLEVAQPLADPVAVDRPAQAPPARADNPPATTPARTLPPADVPPPPLPETDLPPAVRNEPPAANTPPALEPPAPPRVNPPTPANPVPAPPARTPAQQAQATLDQNPELAQTAIRVQDLGQGQVQLTGKVPSAYEAMRAYLSTLRTPGVTAVDDRLEFPLPDPGAPRNPLRDRASPDDARDYLSAQIDRQLMKQARVERILVDSTAILVVLQGAELSQRPRLEAVVRSMPLLRGYQLMIEWSRESR